MTENSKIFIAKQGILNILAQQEFSLGLSIYILKDILQELDTSYQKIVKQELEKETIQENIQEDNNQTEQIEQENNTEEEEEIIINSDIYPISWEEEEDQAD